MGAHLVNGTFQSDKYPTTPAGKVPLSVKDPKAQPFLWDFAEGHREKDAEFTDDLQMALLLHGHAPKSLRLPLLAELPEATRNKLLAKMEAERVARIRELQALEKRHPFAALRGMILDHGISEESLGRWLSLIHELDRGRP